MPDVESLAGSELVIGIVAPLGADLDRVEAELEHALREVNYSVHRVHLSRLLQDRFGEIPPAEKATFADVAEKYAQKMVRGTEFCRRTQRKDAMAMLAIDAIRVQRTDSHRVADRPSRSESATPLPRAAYLIHQLKRPEEVQRLRNVYEARFRLLAVWESRDARIDRLARRLAKDAESSDINEFKIAAEELVDRDDREMAFFDRGPKADAFGQNVRDTYPLADVFVSSSVPGDDDRVADLSVQLRRFVRAVFGAPEITPGRDEFGLYVATAAAIRSGSLARQVGAAICTPVGEVISVGTNEVPKPGGGLYWYGDVGDDRDIARGHDESDLRRHSMVGDVLQRLQGAGWLSAKLKHWPRERLVAEALDRERDILRSASVMDVLEYVRAMHAEQAAITDAAMRGIAIRGATLYVTTFPCHECARMILAAGLQRIVYIEPYTKSRAVEQYPAGITTDPVEKSARVKFVPFIGIAPRFFRSAFEWTTSRKTEDGSIIPWDALRAVPRTASKYPGHIVAEQLDTDEFAERLRRAGIGTAVTEGQKPRGRTTQRTKTPRKPRPRQIKRDRK